MDVLEYTNNIATKTTSFASPNQIIIGEAVYDKLDNKKQNRFNKSVSITNHGISWITLLEIFMAYMAIQYNFLIYANDNHIHIINST